MSFLVILKSPKVGKKVEKIGLGSFKIVQLDGLFFVRLVSSNLHTF